MNCLVRLVERSYGCIRSIPLVSTPKESSFLEMVARYWKIVDELEVELVSLVIS